MHKILNWDLKFCEFPVNLKKSLYRDLSGKFIMLNAHKLFNLDKHQMQIALD